MKNLKFLPLHIGYDIQFSDGLETRVRFNKLEIIKDNYHIVKNDVYMIPFDEKIYLYSKNTGQQIIKLPPGWNSLDFDVFRLSKSDKVKISEFSFDEGVIQVNFEARCPILLEKK